MRFQIVQDFSAALDDVERGLADEEFIARMAELPKLGDPHVVHRADSGHLLHLHVRYRFTGDVSPAVRRVVDPNRLVWIHQSTVDRSTHTAAWRIVPEHYAGMLTAEGTSHLQAAGPDRTRRVTEGEVRVRFPLVGRRVEQALVSGLEEHAEAEAALFDRWFSEQGA